MNYLYEKSKELGYYFQKIDNAIQNRLGSMEKFGEDI